MSKSKVVLGLDIGNGTINASAVVNGVIREVFFLAMTARGDMVKQMDPASDSLKDVSVPDAVQHLNGGVGNIIVEHRGVDWAVGLTCANITQDSYNPKGQNRFAMIDRTQIILKAALQCLADNQAEFTKNVDVHLSVGMPPGDFFSDSRKSTKDNIKLSLGGLQHTYCGYNFTVSDKIATSAEGLGVFYDYIFDDNGKREKAKADTAYLILDPGSRTFDSMIVRDMVFYPNSNMTDDTLGTNRVFSMSASRYNEETGQSLRDSDVELAFLLRDHYQKYGKRIKADVLRDIVLSEVDFYLQDIQSYVLNKYGDAGLMDYFDEILLSGGIIKLYPREIRDVVTIGAGSGLKPVIVRDVESNARGYRKLLQKVLKVKVNS